VHVSAAAVAMSSIQVQEENRLPTAQFVKAVLVITAENAIRPSALTACVRQTAQWLAKLEMEVSAAQITIAIRITAMAVHAQVLYPTIALDPTIAPDPTIVLNPTIALDPTIVQTGNARLSLSVHVTSVHVMRTRTNIRLINAPAAMLIIKEKQSKAAHVRRTNNAFQVIAILVNAQLIVPCWGRSAVVVNVIAMINVIQTDVALELADKPCCEYGKAEMMFL
jgi:hypothetical protein